MITFYPKCVLFDLDGVLVDACDWHYDALNTILIGAGYSAISRDDHNSTFNGLPTKVKLKMLGITGELANKINDQKQKHTLEIIKSKATIMAEKIQLLKYLRSNGTKIACVMNSIRETAEEMLRSTGQLPYIDLIVSNEDVVRNKPYPDCYNHAIRILGCDPTQSLCVEDSQKGIEAATASVVSKIWIVSDSTQVTLENYIKFIQE